jgi:hypothetical protein
MAGVAGRSGRKDKEWRDAIRLALARRDKGDEKALVRLADSLISCAEAGDIQAMKEIGDRLDGKPKQALEHEVGENLEDWLERLGKASGAIQAQD